MQLPAKQILTKECCNCFPMGCSSFPSDYFLQKSFYLKRCATTCLFWDVILFTQLVYSKTYEQPMSSANLCFVSMGHSLNQV